MNLQITGNKNLIISPSVKILVEDKISGKLNKLVTKLEPLTADVIIDKDKFDNFIVSFDLLLGKDKIYAKTSHPKLESALVDISEDAERQIKRHKADQVNYSLG